MNRKEFIRACALLGLSIPLQSALVACRKEELNSISGTAFEGTVIVIGAGPAGMTAAHLLRQQGIQVRVLEANDTYGGRIRHNLDFTDFPISLGGEWLHVNKSVLDQAINDSSVNHTIQLAEYNGSDQIGYYIDGELLFTTLEEDWGTIEDQKFVGTSWLGFFEQYILPGVSDAIEYNKSIVSINYESDQVSLLDQDGQNYQADKVILTVPLKILQDDLIKFIPALPSNKQKAIAKATIWSGIKVFMEFTESFYPAFLGFADSETSQGQRLYYDAAYGQNTDSNILGLFAVGQQAEVYQQYTGDELRDYILAELDEVFDGQASANFVKYIIQNWNEEPFARAAYLEDNAPSSISSRMSIPLNNKLYFAGDSYTQADDWSAVHNAIRSARDAVFSIV